MSDGRVLRAEIFYPKDRVQASTILVRLPLPGGMKGELMLEAVGRLWASRGYVVLLQATRGHHHSDGDPTPFLSERSDGLDTLAWIAQQEFYNGTIFGWGGSYFAYTALTLADQREPGFNAFFVQIGSSNWYPFFYPGGAFALESSLFWSLRDGWKTPSSKTIDRAANAWPVRDAAKRAGSDVAFFREWASHPNEDEFWKSKSGVPMEEIVSPMLIMGGWYDPFLPQQLFEFKRLHEKNPEVAEKSRLIIGPWSHADVVKMPEGFEPRNYRFDSFEPALSFFESVISEKGSPSAPVRLFVMGENRWREFNSWPPKAVKPTSLYLSSNSSANSVKGDGTLLAEAASYSKREDSFLYDPNSPVPSAGGAMLGPRAGIVRQDQVEGREDVLVYSSEPLEEDLLLLGPVQVEIYFSSSALSTDISAKLTDVNESGVSFNVSEGILRIPRSDAGLSKPERYTIALQPTARRFFKGHRIRLQISSSSFPLYDRNPNTGVFIPSAKNSIAAQQRVLHGSAYPSRLIVKYLDIVPPLFDP